MSFLLLTIPAKDMNFQLLQYIHDKGIYLGQQTEQEDDGECQYKSYNTR